MQVHGRSGLGYGDMELEISTSPRSTWVWAPDDQTGEAVRAILTAAGQAGHAAAGPNAEARVTDVDIGVVALDALDRCWRPATRSDGIPPSTR